MKDYKKDYILFLNELYKDFLETCIDDLKVIKKFQSNRYVREMYIIDMTILKQLGNEIKQLKKE